MFTHHTSARDARCGQFAAEIADDHWHMPTLSNAKGAGYHQELVVFHCRLLYYRRVKTFFHTFSGIVGSMAPLLPMYSPSSSCTPRLLRMKLHLQGVDGH